MRSKISRRAALAVVATAFASTALAHHGWSWTSEERFELTGTIEDVFVGNPHASVTVAAEDGSWIVDLAPPSRTRAAGFTEEVAKAGDAITAIGNRSSDPAEKRMKAVRIIVNGATYDVYPDRVDTIES
jgi:hypothetical protein